MKRITLLLAVVLWGSVAVAHAAVDGRNPLKLALQHSDVPATVKGSLLGPAAPHLETQDALRFLGTGLKAADYSYAWPAGGTVATPIGAVDKEWYLSGEVYVAPSIAAAKTLFRNGKAAQHGFFSDFPDSHLSRLNLQEGDEQFALLGPDAGGPQAMVFVRKGSVVWELRVTHSPAQWHVSKAQVVALLKMYAAKQRARVGSG